MFLTEVISEFKRNNIRVSIFMDPNLKMIENAALTGADRIELFTEDFAKQFELGNEHSIDRYIKSAKLASELNLGVNAGHDLNLNNIKFFADRIPDLKEVSIGHALICEALYLGLENVINMYRYKLK
jgi:pyridoxine 5-phosphate synthase